MKKSFLLILSICIFLTVIVGCSRKPDKEKLQDQAKIIAHQLLTNKLSKIISDNSKHHIFELEPYRIVIISKEDLSHEINLIKSKIDFFYKYNAIECSYQIQQIDISEIFEQNGEIYCELSILVNRSMFERLEKKGIILSKFIPSHPQMSEKEYEKQAKKFKNIFLVKFLPERFDYFKLMKQTGHSRTETLWERIRVKWNRSQKCWEATLNKETYALSKPNWINISEKKLESFLEQLDFVKTSDGFFLSSDIKLKHKYDAGWFFVNNKWQSHQEYKQGIELKKVIDSISSYKKASLNGRIYSFYSFEKSLSDKDFFTLLEALKKYTEAPIEIRLEGLEKAKEICNLRIQRKDIDFLKKTEAIIKDSKFLAEIRTENYQKILKPYQKQQKKLKELAEQLDLCYKYPSVDSIIKFSKLNDKITGFSTSNEYSDSTDVKEILKDFLESSCLFLKAHGTGIKRVQHLVAPNLYVYYKDCPNCNHGEIACSYCNSSGVCHLCRGTGRQPLSSLTKKPRYTSCSTSCSYCGGGTCPQCRGTGNRWDLKKIEQVRKKTFSQLRKFYLSESN